MIEFEEIFEDDITHTLKIRYEDMREKRSEEIKAKHISYDEYLGTNDYLNSAAAREKDKFYSVSKKSYNKNEISNFTLQEADGGAYIKPINSIKQHIFESDCGIYAPFHLKTYILYVEDIKKYYIVTKYWTTY